MSVEDEPRTGSDEPAASTARSAGEEVSGARASLLEAFGGRVGAGRAVLLTFLAFFTALVVGALVIMFSDKAVLSAWSYFFSDPAAPLSASWHAIYNAYSALFAGSVGSPHQIVTAIFSGDTHRISNAFYPLSETVVAACPLIFTGLAVALGFRAGLFNIGAEGQLIVGGLAAGFFGFHFGGLPLFLHLPLAVVVGFAGGAAWGFVPGFLKARTGAHEVITTIMMNYVAIYLAAYLLNSTIFRQPGRTDPISRTVADSAKLPHLAGSNLRLHAGIIVAVLVAGAVFWILHRSTLGFQFRAVGSNPDASRTAGIDVNRAFILAMVLSGGLAGLAGANQVLGVQYNLAPGFSSNLGFDGITVALLGRGNAAGVVASAFLFGILRAGAVQMQAATGTSVEIVTVIEALVIVFVAAPALIRAIYRWKVRGTRQPAMTTGWGA